MKKTIAVVLIIGFVMGFISGCSLHEKNLNVTGVLIQKPQMQKSEEIIVFAAASLTETLTILGKAYMESHPGIKILFNFDSSGTLKTQIQEGAECDIFISAGQKQMDQLGIQSSVNPNEAAFDFIMRDSRCDILENKVVLAVSQNSSVEIDSFEQMSSELKNGNILLAIGNSDVPVGQYTQKILKYLNLSENDLAASGAITYGTNVKEVTTQVAEGIVDCGIIYQTDAYSAGLEIVDTASADMCGQVIYPAAIMKSSKKPQEAKNFLDYILSDMGDQVFASVGFTPIG